MLTTLALLSLTACNTPGDRRGGMVITPRNDAGSSSGLPASRALTSLSASEIRTLCTYMSAQFGAEPVECGDVVTVPGTTVDECVADFGAAPAACTATVGEAERCSEVIGADRCAVVGGSRPAECALLFACASETR